MLVLLFYFGFFFILEVFSAVFLLLHPSAEGWRESSHRRPPVAPRGEPPLLHISYFKLCIVHYRGLIAQVKKNYDNSLCLISARFRLLSPAVFHIKPAIYILGSSRYRTFVIHLQSFCHTNELHKLTHQPITRRSTKQNAGGGGGDNGCFSVGAL